MAKIKMNFYAEEDLVNRVRATSERLSWSFATATEKALELFLAEFENAKIIKASTPESAPKTEKVTR